MKTCFICGERAWRLDRASGEPICAKHVMERVRAKSRYKGEGHLYDRTQDGARMMAVAIANWHAGSAYARDRAMAKRLREVLS